MKNEKTIYSVICSCRTWCYYVAIYKNKSQKNNFKIVAVLVILCVC